MVWHRYKYFLSFLLPLAGAIGFRYGGWLSPGSFYLAFVILPLVEVCLPMDHSNLDQDAESEESQRKFYDWILYLNIPILYGLFFWFLDILSQGGISLAERLAYILNMGILAGTMGINVGHELGHRKEGYHHVLSQLLLLPSLYTHFFVEHNRGHHKWVATPFDPASARKNEAVYTFWIRSVFGTYRKAWVLEAQRLRQEGRGVMDLSNLMLRFTLLHILWLSGIAWAFGVPALISAIGAAIVGFLLLETVNYVEHYALRRKEVTPGHYEPVTLEHSWNSDHELGRIFLYELSRHSDHHYKASRKYQVLRSFSKSPQLPFGYPTAIITSLLPPLWFSVMERQMQKEQAA